MMQPKRSIIFVDKNSQSQIYISVSIKNVFPLIKILIETEKSLII